MQRNFHLSKTVSDCNDEVSKQSVATIYVACFIIVGKKNLINTCHKKYMAPESPSIIIMLSNSLS